MSALTQSRLGGQTGINNMTIGSSGMKPVLSDNDMAAINDRRFSRLPVSSKELAQGPAITYTASTPNGVG